MPIYAHFGCFFGGFETPRWDIILKKLSNVKSTGRNGSSNVLTMPVSVVVSEKLLGQKGVTKKMQKKKNVNELL